MPCAVRIERAFAGIGGAARFGHPSCTESPLSVHFRSHTEGRRMDSILGLSGQLMGLWLAIVGIAIVFGVLYAIGSSLGHWKRHRNHEDQGGRAG